MREQLVFLGGRIKQLRKERNMTLQLLAEKTKLTAGLLSKIENFRTVPSLPALVNIAAALDVDLAELFRGMAMREKRRWTLINEEQQQPIEREEGRGLRYRMILETPLSAVSLQMMFVTVAPECGGGMVSTEADELVYVLSGNFGYRIGDDLVTLVPGDTLYFDGTLPHGPVNASGGGGTLIACYLLKETES